MLSRIITRQRRRVPVLRDAHQLIFIVGVVGVMNRTPHQTAMGRRGSCTRHRLLSAFKFRFSEQSMFLLRIDQPTTTIKEIGSLSRLVMI